MMRSLFSGVSGLKGHQTRMDVIGNNIANVNTTGFKSSRVTFSDTLNQTISGASSPQKTLTGTTTGGGTNPKQIGLGSGVSSIDTIFTDGSVQSTGKNTDLCLSGNGLFVVKNASGQEYYTRNGNFEFDGDGNLVLSGSGMLVQGYQGTDGNLSSDVTGIKVESGKSISPVATTKVTYANNLNSAAATIKEISGGTLNQMLVYTYTTAADGPVSAMPSTPLQITFDTGETVKFTSGGPFTVGTQTTYTKDADGDSFTATAANPTTITLANGKNVANVTDGKTYTVGTDYTETITTNGSQEKASAKNRIKVTTSSGYTSAELTSGNYTVGGYYNYTENNSVTPSADTSVVVTLKNGKQFTGVIGTAYTVGNTATFSATDAAVDADSTISVNGTTLNGVAVGTKYCTAAAYNADPIKYAGYTYQYNGADITTLNVTANVTQLDVSSKITSMDAISEITELEIEATPTQIDQFSERYIADKENPVTITLSDGTTTTATSGSYALSESLPLTTTVTIYDTLGNAHSVPIYFTKTATGTGEEVTDPDTGVKRTDGNKWTISLSPDGASGTSTQITESDGSVTTISLKNPITIWFTAEGGKPILDDGTSMTTLHLTNGANETQDVMIDFNDLTQYAGGSTIKGGTNGRAAGTLESIAVDSTGVITGTYSNGEKLTEGQIAVAQFNNAAGLTKSGNSLYQASNNSGEVSRGTIGGTVGEDIKGVTITPSALEMSNVDISDQFSDMIITQRGFQSNSKIITVSDEMLETLINMKR